MTDTEDGAEDKKKRKKKATAATESNSVPQTGQFPYTLRDVRASKSARRSYTLRECILALLKEMHDRENTLDVFSETRALEQLVLDRARSVGLIVNDETNMSESDKIASINYGIQTRMNEMQITLRSYTDFLNNHIYALGQIKALTEDEYDPIENKRLASM